MRPTRPMQPASPAAPASRGAAHSLPVHPTPIIGREREIAELRADLLRPGVSLVTLVGPGGAGKTRLAMHAGVELADDFPDGVVAVPLEAVRDPDQVISAVALALGVREAASQPLAASVAAHLQDRQMLLVLDNFEQVLPAATRVVAALLAAAPRLKVLVTSRAALRLRGEQEFPVPPLEVQGTRFKVQGSERSGVELGTLNLELELPPAVALFVERARGVRPEFALTAENAGTVAAICRRLDGLPLAIELAAARSVLFGPAAILARLERRLPLLAGGAHDLPERQQTMRGTIAWSYDLLDAAQQALFRRMAVFAGGYTLEAVTAVAGVSSFEFRVGGDAPGDELETRTSELDVLDDVVALVNNSLLRREDGEPRLSMFETIREYGLERLAASREQEAVRQRHLAYVVDLAERADVGLRTPQQARWLDRLETKHDNIRAALAWCLQRGEIASGLRIGGAIWWFWDTRAHLTEGRGWLDALLARADEADALPDARAGALLGASTLTRRHGNLDEARALVEQAVELRRGTDNFRGTTHAIYLAGEVAREQGDLARAEAYFEECLSLAREVGEERSHAAALMSLGVLARNRGEFEEARSLYEEALHLDRQRDDRYSMAVTLNNLAGVIAALGDVPRSATLLDESLHYRRELGDTRGVALALRNLAEASIMLGDPALARARLAEALTLYQELANQHGIAVCLETLAKLAWSEGQAERAAWLIGEAEHLRETIGMPIPPAEGATRATVLDAARAALGDAVFDRAWAKGRAAPIDQAIDEALADADEADAAGAPPALDGRSVAVPDSLTSREAEVLRLLAAGQSNKEIAAQLRISVHTAERHVVNIYAKIGARGRAEAIAYALGRPRT